MDKILTKTTVAGLMYLDQSDTVNNTDQENLENHMISVGCDYNEG